MKKTIDELEDYKQELEESLKFVHHAHVPTDWIEHRKHELEYQILRVNDAIEDLKKTDRMYTAMGIIIYTLFAACGAFLLWAYLISE